MTKTTQGLLIGLASALIGVLFSPGPRADGHTAVDRATVVRCNR